MKKVPIFIKRIGVWIDHSQTLLFQDVPPVKMTKKILSEEEIRPRYSGEVSDKTQVGRYRSSNREHTKNEKEIRLQKAYYKQVAEALVPFDEILIFGPTTAGEELFNRLVKSKKFSGKVIHLKNTDYQTEKQMLAFVKKQWV